ncbi:sigma-70 family RNA polymerase sigma factor [Compostibacter hankyongensis]|uniref:Sigma-70 family RNA polymerase sigma factor n=2 Tax=Compostibacter hankyongensis TaxID=1007089 RepID=A0ABP8FIA6_9BACT
MCKQNDQCLIDLYRQGREDALAELICRHKEKIFTSIVLLVKDQYLAEDIFQDTFIKIIDTLRTERYTEKGKFLPWAVRIAHNLCVDHFRRTKRTPVIRTQDNKDIFNVLRFTDPGAEERLITRQSHSRVQEMLDMLPEEQREVIILRHYAELSFKEIADLTQVSINTALGRMRYGLINLRKMMSEKQIVL